MSALAEACAAYLEARECLKAAPEGTEEESYALAQAVSMLGRMRDELTNHQLATSKVGGGT